MMSRMAKTMGRGRDDKQWSCGVIYHLLLSTFDHIHAEISAERKITLYMKI